MKRLSFVAYALPGRLHDVDVDSGYNFVVWAHLQSSLDIRQITAQIRKKPW